MGKLEKLEKFSAKGKVDKILPLAQGSDQQTSLAAIQALGNFISQADVMGALAKVLDSGDAERRKAAAAAFAKAEGSYAESVLMHRMEREKDESVRDAMRESLASVKSRTK